MHMLLLVWSALTCSQSLVLILGVFILLCEYVPCSIQYKFVHDILLGTCSSETKTLYSNGKV